MTEPFFKCKACGEAFDWDTPTATNHIGFQCNPDYKTKPILFPFAYSYAPSDREEAKARWESFTGKKVEE